MKTIQSSVLLAIGAGALSLLTGCESSDHSKTAVGYYDMGIYDPWYYGEYYYHHDDADIIVTPPDSSVDAPRPSHPIANPPPSMPRPTPMPSMPAPRPSMRR
jgi:hypothetical protein